MGVMAKSNSLCQLLGALLPIMISVYAAPTAHVYNNGISNWQNPLNTTLNGTILSMHAQSCDEGDDCYDMRMQNVPGCTSGWTLHGLWPQWAESCTSEKFDPNQVSSIRSDLEKLWPSCAGSAESFWYHEWEKHGTCSKMSQLSYFKKALSLLQQYRSKCDSNSSPSRATCVSHRTFHQPCPAIHNCVMGPCFCERRGCTVNW